MPIPAIAAAAGSASAPVNAVRRAADPFAQALSTAMNPNGGSGSSQSAGTGPAGGVMIHEKDLQRVADQSLAEFKRSLKDAFKDAGVDTNQPIRLESDGNGGVTVVGHHPDRDKIEKIFAENPDLAAKFQAISQRFSELQAMQAGDKQPLISPTFGLTIHQDDFKVAFQ